MIRIFIALGASAVALLSASCCCTSEVQPPGLRPLPQFRPIESPPAFVEPEIHRAK
jgi:hypothetical protein